MFAVCRHHNMWIAIWKYSLCCCCCCCCIGSMLFILFSFSSFAAHFLARLLRYIRLKNSPLLYRMWASEWMNEWVVAISNAKMRISLPFPGKLHLILCNRLHPMSIDSPKIFVEKKWISFLFTRHRDKITGRYTGLSAYANIIFFRFFIFHQLSLVSS